MPYREETFVVRDENRKIIYQEKSKYFSLRLGGKKTRIKNTNETPDWMKIANQKQKEKKLSRLIQTNFTRDDIYLTLTYETEPEFEEGKKKLQKFLRTLRRRYKKKGWELKYIYRTEYRGHRLHHHLIINDPTHGNVKRRDIQELWKEGMINHYSFQRYDGEHEDAKRLSAYFCKESKQNIQEQKEKQAWHPSRNLKKPEIHHRTIRSKKWKEKPVPPAGMELIEVINTFTTWGYPMQIAKYRKRGRQKYEDTGGTYWS